MCSVPCHLHLHVHPTSQGNYFTSVSCAVSRTIYSCMCTQSDRATDSLLHCCVQSLTMYSYMQTQWDRVPNCFTPLLFYRLQSDVHVHCNHISDFILPCDFRYLIWNDCFVSTDRVAELKPYQRLNHFPGMGEISRKDCLARNMAK